MNWFNSNNSLGYVKNKQPLISSRNSNFSNSIVASREDHFASPNQQQLISPMNIEQNFFGEMHTPMTTHSQGPSDLDMFMPPNIAKIDKDIDRIERLIP